MIHDGRRRCRGSLMKIGDWLQWENRNVHRPACFRPSNEISHYFFLSTCVWSEYIMCDWALLEYVGIDEFQFFSCMENLSVDAKTHNLHRSLEGQLNSHSNAKWDKNGNQFNNFVCIRAPAIRHIRRHSTLSFSLSFGSKYLSCVHCEQSFFVYFYIFFTSSVVCGPTACNPKKNKNISQKKPTTIQHHHLADRYSIS